LLCHLLLLGNNSLYKVGISDLEGRVITREDAASQVAATF
jgi:hypothetical protein